MTAAHTGRSAEEVVACFSPRTVPPEAALFARDVVGSVAPQSPARAKALLFACSKLGAFGISVGLALRAEVLFHPSVVDRFVLVGTDKLSSATQRTFRTNLRFVAARVVPSHVPAPVPLSRERAKAPYGRAEIGAYLALARSQPSTARAMHAAGLISLGAGAGLIGEDLRAIRGHDVIWRSGGLVVQVAGRRPRVVPVLSLYHEVLADAAGFAGAGYVTGGTDPTRHNVTTPLISALSGGLHLARLDTGRLRSTWLAECAQMIGLPAFMAAAGISCSQRLGDVVAGLAVGSEAEMVALLGATP